ncbi:MAG: hypothetical protein HY719_13735 [Planctomycetes bacterium]|nr:hypothetical protein [Planctomycetota bacterium]
MSEGATLLGELPALIRDPRDDRYRAADRKVKEFGWPAGMIDAREYSAAEWTRDPVDGGFSTAEIAEIASRATHIPEELAAAHCLRLNGNFDSDHDRYFEATVPAAGIAVATDLLPGLAAGGTLSSLNNFLVVGGQFSKKERFYPRSIEFQVYSPNPADTREVRRRFAFELRNTTQRIRGGRLENYTFSGGSPVGDGNGLPVQGNRRKFTSYNKVPMCLVIPNESGFALFAVCVVAAPMVADVLLKVTMNGLYVSDSKSDKNNL